MPHFKKINPHSPKKYSAPTGTFAILDREKNLSILAIRLVSRQGSAVEFLLCFAGSILYGMASKSPIPDPLYITVMCNQTSP